MDSETVITVALYLLALASAFRGGMHWEAHCEEQRQKKMAHWTTRGGP